MGFLKIQRDLIRWGFYLGSNSNRPYFEGHERADVVVVRNKLVDYFKLKRLKMTILKILNMKCR